MTRLGANSKARHRHNSQTRPNPNSDIPPLILAKMLALPKCLAAIVYAIITSLMVTSSSGRVLLKPFVQYGGLGGGDKMTGKKVKWMNHIYTNNTPESDMYPILDVII